MLMEVLKYKEILRICLICEALRLSAHRIPQGVLLPSPHPKKAETCGTLMMEKEGESSRQ